ncbi:hypothetical protein AAFF_G00006570 [Aldrovandia affinis]|uniref:Uncharacterized protein n=1 Tax=Aldrovandia affinis TaxID=143900 RepID=A0AAD7X4A0_9TELE|nr:hypothetical protein AAFF_G00006570 [Aldrovandia affinis]
MNVYPMPLDFLPTSTGQRSSHSHSQQCPQRRTLPYLPAWALTPRVTIESNLGAKDSERQQHSNARAISARPRRKHRKANESSLLCPAASFWCDGVNKILTAARGSFPFKSARSKSASNAFEMRRRFSSACGSR